MSDLTILTDFIAEHKQALGALALLSVALFVGCLVFVPWLVVRIPPEYFLSRQRPRPLLADRHPVLRWTGLIVKNLVGAILILAGLAMLILPGQGILTLVMGVMLLNFPGKHRLERRIIQIKPVLRSINWLRRRSNVDPIRIEAIGGEDAPRRRQA